MKNGRKRFGRAAAKATAAVTSPPTATTASATTTAATPDESISRRVNRSLPGSLSKLKMVSEHTTAVTTTYYCKVSSEIDKRNFSKLHLD